MISLLCTPGGQVERGRPKTERFGVVLGLFSHLLSASGCSIRAGGSPRVPNAALSPSRGFQAGRAPRECSALAPAAPIPRSGDPKAGFSSQSGPKAGFSSSQPCPRAGFSSQPHKELLDGVSKLKNTAGGWRRAGSAPPRGKTGRKRAENGQETGPSRTCSPSGHRGVWI